MNMELPLTIHNDKEMQELAGNNHSIRAVQKVIINKDVTSIGISAFRNCSNLTSVTIPSSVTSIGYCAFACCESLTNVTIPNSIKSIGDSMFHNCKSLTDITIPGSVTSIGNHAFAYCKSLTSLTIPDSVTSIGGNAFATCYNLTNITIPGSVTSIGPYAFYGCLNLKVHVPHDWNDNIYKFPSNVKVIKDPAYPVFEHLSALKNTLHTGSNIPSNDFARKLEQTLGINR